MHCIPLKSSRNTSLRGRLTLTNHPFINQNKNYFIKNILLTLTALFQYSVKIGTPSVEELITISENIAERWKSLGIRLNIGEAELVEFERYAESERPFKMLLYWKRREAEKQPTKGTYLVLHDALCHPSVAYKGLADIICRQ